LSDPIDIHFIECCPDFAVILDREHRVVRASAGLREAVALCAPGEFFSRSLDAESERRFLHLASAGRDAASAPIGVELVHRGHQRLVNASWRFFDLDKSAAGTLGGIGREMPGEDLAAQTDGLKRRYQESVSQLASLTGRLREMAMVDSLTGVLNRRAFLDQAAIEWSRARRSKTQLSFLMIDLDGFKQVNDTLGHAAGDSLLQHIGALLRTTLRGSDIPARLGGDEFAALIPETGIEGAVRLGERFLGRLASQPLRTVDQEVSASVSIGAATALDCASLEEMMAKADAALYNAKKQGRARVCKAD
jgi:diguanylate cyclase (GGDEF)-like protein